MRRLSCLKTSRFIDDLIVFKRGIPAHRIQSKRSMSLSMASAGPGIALLVVLIGQLPLRAEVLWEGDPSKGRKVFNNLNFEGGERHSRGSGTILPAKDRVHGEIWRVHKPAADKRAEIRGAAGWSDHQGKGGLMKQEVTCYLGWRYKFAMPRKTKKSWACFQWKSYPDPRNPDGYNQNYPFVMTYNGENLALTLHGPDWTKHRDRIAKVWSQPVKIGEWVDIVLAVRPSRDEKKGYVEIYFNGKLQTLESGGTRVHGKTMDGLEVAPKWGVYGGGAIGMEITVDLADLRIGTDLESVQPEPLR